MPFPQTHGFLFDDGPRGRVLDVPRYAFEVAFAKARRRNPPFPPWWRRYVGSWQTFAPERAGPSANDARERPLIFGLCQAWNEDDVIYATVRNLFGQGVDEVFVIDDGSDDDTAAEAAAAGATVLRQPAGGAFNEVRRTERIARVIDERTASAGRPLWWIMVDADEFPRGPGRSTIRELVGTLAPEVDTVGSRVLEHYPSRSSAPEPRHHPIDELRMARPYLNPACPAGHWKHQLLHVRAPGDLRFRMGRHTIAAPPDRRPVVESRSSLLMHHFPLRGRERTERRFRQATARSGRYGAGSDKLVGQRTELRLRMLELAYEEKYELMPAMFPGQRNIGFPVHDWRELVEPAEREPHHRPGLPL
ncbi:hypothetical protein GCM10009678_77900 [Actinomadura kijaniata]|uniref:Glycosyltransferase n=1 Tax=Actinomadura namibiensis TaxID=182080 RepID=A0A7W3LVJ0_ACTNM|nr:glycosyltransferase family 2 protein [Actinomadura namibiensis]MBA8955029.1 hypothetical protein [Actinomadura namibiensis]